MSVLFGPKPERRKEKRALFGITSAADLIPRRTAAPAQRYVSHDNAMQNSAVWACLRLRADLISTLPLDVYRDVRLNPDEPKMQVEMDKPPVLKFTGGPDVRYDEWCYMSQIELDRSGNAIGYVREKDHIGRPVVIDLYPTTEWGIKVKNNRIVKYRLGNEEFDPEDIWHERQYAIAGCHVGLSPVMYAAYTLGEFMSVQEFVTSWFSGGAVPRARLRNVNREIDEDNAVIVKESWRASVAMNEPFVYGSDWEYDFIQADQASADWLKAKQFDTVDIARFFGCPTDLIDAAVSGEHITYANIQQRNLQFLIMNLGPAIIRREKAFSDGLVPKPRYVKLNSDALLRMDPQTRAEMLRLQIESRQICPSEARALENRPPFTEEQYAEFEKLWPLNPPKDQPKGL